MNFLRKLFGLPPRQSLLTADQFREAFLVRLAKRLPATKVTVKSPLILALEKSDGTDYHVGLENAYHAYTNFPDRKEALIDTYLKSSLEQFLTPSTGVDVNRILPVIKHAGFIEGAKQALKERGMDVDKWEQVYEPYNPELTILYAEDTASTIRYLTPGVLEEAKIERNDLRKIATENLRFLLPRIEAQDSNGIYRLLAGGDYEASLILMDALWTGDEIKVNGAYVVGIPSRDVLLVTGSDDPQKVTALGRLTAELAKKATYSISDKLFVYRETMFQVFEPRQ